VSICLVPFPIRFDGNRVVSIGFDRVGVVCDILVSAATSRVHSNGCFCVYVLPREGSIVTARCNGGAYQDQVRVIPLCGKCVVGMLLGWGIGGSCLLAQFGCMMCLAGSLRRSVSRRWRIQCGIIYGEGWVLFRPWD